ncbi:hypothetical protein ACF0H5_011356 [Mactra antiquata]
MMRIVESKGIVKIPKEIDKQGSYTDTELENMTEDLVANCLAKLQDGLKVTPNEATDALKHYQTFQGELERLKLLISRPSRYPKMTSCLYMQEKSFKDRTKKIIEAKEKEIVDLKQKLTEMTLRLSAIVGTQVSDVDEEKSDLTDINKPIQIAEDYRAIYDNEYQDALEELTVTMEEARVLVYLGKVTWTAHQFATDIVERQLSELMSKEVEILRIMSRPSYEDAENRRPIVSQGMSARKFERDETLQLLKDYQRCLARTSVPGIKQIFLTLMNRNPPQKGTPLTDGVKKFLQKVVEQSYLMCIQEPPMHLEWVRLGDVLDPQMYKTLKGDGTRIVGTIWPVVLRHRGGPVMSRGIVDVMYGQTHGPKPILVEKYKHKH